MSEIRVLKPATAPQPSRIPPWSPEAEESVLGACLLSREAVDRAVEALVPEDFYRPANGALFGLMRALRVRGEPIDTTTVGSALRESANLEACGFRSAEEIAPRLFALIHDVPSPGSVAHYASILVEKARLRRMIEAAGAISDLAYSEPEDIDAAGAQAENLVFAATQGRGRSEIVDAAGMLDAAQDLIGATSTGMAGAPTGLRALDAVLRGLRPGRLYAIGARASAGKSALAFQTCVAAARAGYRPLLFSLEMTNGEVTLRMLSYLSGIPVSDIERGQLSLAEDRKLSEAIVEMMQLGIVASDSPSATILEIGAKARRVAPSKEGLGLLVVDYLQLIPPVREKSTRAEEVSEVSRGLKILARQLDIPVIACSQLNRESEKAVDRRPQLSHLRESGGIEQDCDVVVLIWHNPNELAPDGATLLVEKHRGGPKAEVKVRWNGPLVRFQDGAW